MSERGDYNLMQKWKCKWKTFCQGFFLIKEPSSYRFSLHTGKSNPLSAR